MAKVGDVDSPSTRWAIGLADTRRVYQPTSVASLGMARHSGGNRGGRWLLGLSAIAAAAFLVHLAVGSTEAGDPFALRIPPAEVLREIVSPGRPEELANNIVWNLRLPRAIACLLVGAILGIVGSAFQALFRNPLAEPYIVGASSGAAVGGAAAVVAGFSMAWGGAAMTLAAFGTSMASLGLVMAIARVRGRLDPQRLLLAGVVSSSMLSALVACVLLGAGEDSNQVLRWLLGSATPMFWDRLPLLAIALAGGGGLLISQSKRLNAFAMGEEAARRLGVPTDRLKPIILATGTAMTAIAVGTVGVIGFLGMVAPHIARRMVGVDWRLSLPAAGLAGAALLLVADIIAQRAVPGAELPVGVVTALVGAPALLSLLRKPAS